MHYDPHASSPQEEVKRQQELFDEHYEEGAKNGERVGIVEGIFIGLVAMGAIWYVTDNFIIHHVR